MLRQPPYIQIAKSALASLEEEYQHGKSLSDFFRVADAIAEAYFYLSQEEPAIEASLVYSEYCLTLTKHEDRLPLTLFHKWFLAGLYRSLAQRPVEAEHLWKSLLETRQRVLPENRLTGDPGEGCIRVYEAYALTKLNHYEMVAEVADKGFQALEEGRGIYKDEPRNNVVEYCLVDVLKAISAYKQKPVVENREKAQAALIQYKDENVNISRQGYSVIFDLQFSYPDIFIPVLPGADPNYD